MNTIIPPCRQHPATMLQRTFRHLLLLALPLMRGLRYVLLPQGAYHWARGVWIDLTAIILLVFLLYVQWRFHTYCLTDRGFFFHRGILLQRDSFILCQHISTLTVERPFYLRALRAARVIVDTDAGNHSRADLIMTVSEKHAQDILAAQKKQARQIQHRYQPRRHHLVVLSLLASNSLSGVILLTTALHHSGRLLGESYRQEVLDNLETIARYVRFVPHTAALIGLVLICGWGIAAVRNLLRILPFTVTRFTHTLAIHTGSLTRCEHLCAVASINFVDIRQTLLCTLLHLHIVFVHCIGYGKERDALSLLVPVSSTKHSEQALHGLLPEFPYTPVNIRPAPYSLLRYTLYPLCIIASLYPIACFAAKLFPLWHEVIGHLLFIAHIPCVWLLTIKIIDRYTAGIAKKDGIITLRYSRRLTLHTAIIPTKKIVSCRFRQSIFQRRRNLGDLFIYTHSESERPHRVKNINAADADALLAAI